MILYVILDNRTLESILITAVNTEFWPSLPTLREDVEIYFKITLTSYAAYESTPILVSEGKIIDQVFEKGQVFVFPQDTFYIWPFFQGKTRRACVEVGHGVLDKL
jgi:hypothetical protein